MKKILILPVFATVIICLFFAQTASAISVVATIPVGISPRYVAYDSAKGELFVTKDDNTVSVIRDSDNTVYATIPVGSGPSGIAYDSGKGEIFVASGGKNSVYEISDATNAVVATIPVGVLPVGVAYDSGKGEIFVANAGDSTVSVISDGTTVTTTTLSSLQNPSIVGQSVTFTAAVTSSGGTPTGTVTFKDGTTTIGSGTLDGTGHTSLSISTLSAGTHGIMAVYLGDSSFNTSTSSVLSQVVLTPARAVNNLANLANIMGAQSSSLGNAQKLLNDNNPSNDNGACGKLGAFINEVNTNKKLTQDQKNLLIGLSNVIKTGIGC